MTISETKLSKKSKSNGKEADPCGMTARTATAKATATATANTGVSPLRFASVEKTGVVGGTNEGEAVGMTCLIELR
jgi:hypothetical protein